MSDETYGQRAQMEDPTMVGTLQAQIEMVWPQEHPVLERMGLNACQRIADLGCGTGRFAGRIAQACPDADVRGIDLFAPHLDLARREYGSERVQFIEGDARTTGWDESSFDMVAARHLVHALGDRDALYAEAHRLLRPGGWIYVLAEDYDGMLFDVPEPARSLFHLAAPAVLPSGTNLRHGRTIFGDLRQAGFEEVRIEPVYLDTTNTPREPFARMLRFWRDGYAGFIAEHASVEPQAIHERFDTLIACVEDPERFACWLLFAAKGRKAGE